ncbi:MAG TPA: hypothetical protein VH744_14495 [Terriglobales bacterium]|jgi:hypothetical protein
MTPERAGKPQITPNEPEHPHHRRDPEERPVENGAEAKEKSLDKTLADSFPTSDPPSSLPDPSGEAGQPEEIRDPAVEELIGLPPGSWAALSIEDRRLVATGATQEEAIENASKRGHRQISLVRAA